MFIVSKFHDYYDTAIVYGIDKECVYNRETTIIKNDKHRAPLYWTDVQFILVGFCGQIKPLAKFGDKYYDNYDDFLNSVPKEKTFYYFSKNQLKEFFNNQHEDVKQYFRKYHVPVFKLVLGFSKNNLELNPCLKDLHFYKYFDAPTAFQEIYMYLSGVLGSVEKDVTNISDKVKLQQHGFDDKSFKTLKGDKKPRAKNRNKKL